MLIGSIDHLPSQGPFAEPCGQRVREAFDFAIEGDFGKSPASDPSSTYRVGGAMIAGLKASARHVSRPRATISDGSEQTIRIGQPCEGGGFRRLGNWNVVVRAGAVTAGLAGRPCADLLTLQDGSPDGTVQLSLPPAWGDLDRRPVAAGPGVPALFNAFLSAFLEQAPHLSDQATEVVVDTLVRLAQMARDTGDGCGTVGREGARRRLLEQARGVIERNLHQPGLAPAHIAEALGISLRQLHVLFKPTGRTFSHYVRSRRLEKARLMLATSPQASVTDIAYASGFDGLSTFFRCFRAAYGRSPGEARASLRRPSIAR